MIDNMLSVVAPHLCSGCGKTGTLLCGRCKSHILDQPFLDCALCGEPSNAGICANHHTAYDKTWIVGERQGALQQLIGGFKFKNMKAAARSLAELLDGRLPPLPKNTVIIPVPTAPSHVRERGYDHILLIAQYFALKRRLSVDSRLLARNNTKTQHGANREDRIKQSVTAFRVIGTVDPLLTYLVIDDVVTTGSTLDTATKLLKQAGARTIWVGALARQPLD